MRTESVERKSVILGRGVLSWNPVERIYDRYGTVRLFASADSDGTDPIHVRVEDLAGRTGSLIAIVVETRKSRHVGDLFRGFRPSTPDVGEMIVLGSGRLFFEPSDPEFVVGLHPDDGRPDDWLNPEALYCVIHQTVDLAFREGDPGDPGGMAWG